ncbi:MAG: LysE family translocator [Granulosicoccus sp.]|nr:LysE family translocator [Granulosicoccus sp.]
MPSVHDLLLYLPAVIALNLTPGNDMLFVLSSGLNYGRSAGVVASLGIAVGSMLQVILAAAGLAPLIATNPLLFNVIRWVGVLYLLWLSFSVFRESSVSCKPASDTASGSTDALPPPPGRSVFYRAVLVNFLNPKVILFVLAFIPQFVDPDRGSTFVQFLILGGILNLSGTLINGAVGFFAGEFHRRVESERWLANLRYVSAILFVIIAARLAI